MLLKTATPIKNKTKQNTFSALASVWWSSCLEASVRSLGVSEVRATRGRCSTALVQYLQRLQVAWQEREDWGAW